MTIVYFAGPLSCTYVGSTDFCTSIAGGRSTKPTVASSELSTVSPVESVSVTVAVSLCGRPGEPVTRPVKAHVYVSSPPGLPSKPASCWPTVQPDEIQEWSPGGELASRLPKASSRSDVIVAGPWDVLTTTTPNWTWASRSGTIAGTTVFEMLPFRSLTLVNVHVTGCPAIASTPPSTTVPLPWATVVEPATHTYELSKSASKSWLANCSET